MNKKIIVIAMIGLFAMTSFTVAPCINALANECKSKEVVSNKDIQLKNTVEISSSPPYPPLLWTYDFFTFYISNAVDPEGDQIFYYIDWGDGSNSGWIGPFYNDPITISHVWTIEGIYQITAKAKDDDSESPMALYELTFFTNSKFFRPSRGYVGLPYYFTIYEQGYEYFIFDWGDGTTSEWFTSTTTHLWNFEGVYEIKIKLKDINGSETPWSEPFHLPIAPIDNQPPTTPDIYGPTNGKVGEKLDYNFLATDPDGANIFYVVSWGCCGTEIHTYGPYISGDNVTISHTYDKTGTFLLRAQAVDIYGFESDWGELQVKIPKDKIISNSLFLHFLEQFYNTFPILQYLICR